MATQDSLNITPLTHLHRELGARMVPFAGYSMPVQFKRGVKHEHLHTRHEAGLFDVSHMGQLCLRGQNAGLVLEKLVPADVMGLPEHKQRYALLTNDEGGILDDLMITNFGDWYYLVVNAACKEADIAHVRAHLEEGVALEELTDRALIALQGPKAVAALGRIQPAVEDLVFMDNQPVTIEGAACYVSRSGYTGEDGFEISIPGDDAERITRLLLDQPEVEPVGLGARDSLRLEAGLCLYGHDLDTTTTPPEASLIWAISKPRRVDGDRPGGFTGADVIMDQIEQRNWSRKRVGLKGEGRAPVREGAELFSNQGEAIGVVTSGTYGPYVEAPVAMGYVETGFSALGTQVYAEVRGKRLPMVVSKLPFIEPRYYRGG